MKRSLLPLMAFGLLSIAAPLSASWAADLGPAPRASYSDRCQRHYDRCMKWSAASHSDRCAKKVERCEAHFARHAERHHGHHGYGYAGGHRHHDRHMARHDDHKMRHGHHRRGHHGMRETAEAAPAK
jgi:hypothetical protein